MTNKPPALAQRYTKRDRNGFKAVKIKNCDPHEYMVAAHNPMLEVCVKCGHKRLNTTKPEGAEDGEPG